MKPWKSLAGIASWVMRLGMVLFIYTRFFGIFMQFRFNTQSFYFAAAFIVFGFLLLAGGFFKQSITVIAGLILLILSVVHIVLGFNGITPLLAHWLLVASVSFYFLTNGNK